MSRWSADGRRFRRERAAFLAAYPVCWLCGHAGADQVDHVVPASQAPWLRYVVSNWRPAHGVNGCPTCGRRCNQERGTGRPQRRRSRRW